MLLLRRVSCQLTRPLPIAVSTGSAHNYTTASEKKVEQLPKEEIEIPNRIPRSPTDILQALASTVGRDPTAPHYKYHDDPYLIPQSNMGKRTFAMAQEAGRKAAIWIRNEHSNLFQHKEAQPFIEAFAPKMVYNEESEVDETVLRRLIQQSEVDDAILVYGLLQQKGVQLSNELKQSFLEFLCFYNHEQPLPEEQIEERWFQQSQAMRERQSKSWKDNELAERLFAEIEPKTAATYAALICGMAKHYQAERAYAYFQEACDKQLELDTRTFNAIISIISLLKETADQRWDLCRELLQQMAQQQLQPNLGTLNALLETVSSFTSHKFSRNCALQVLSEFKQLGIEPCPASYYYVLIIFCRERGPTSHVLVDIVQQLEGKQLEICDKKDTFFFVTAMDICRNHLHDKSLAKKVDALLHTGNNYNLIGDSYKESIYYRNYFALLCQTEPLEEFMQVYDKLVPNIYIPEPGIMEELIKAVELNLAIELLPRLWSDMVIFDHIHRESLLTRVLSIMVQNPPRSTEPLYQQLPAHFAKIALDIYNKINDQSPDRQRRLAFTGQMIGDILSLLVRADDYDNAVTVFAHIERNQHRIPGTPTDQCLLEYVDACIAHKSPSQAVTCLQYAVENNMESLKLATRINEGFTLNEVHLSKMKSLVGDTFLKQKSETML